jgi:hypothetical protein
LHLALPLCRKTSAALIDSMTLSTRLLTWSVAATAIVIGLRHTDVTPALAQSSDPCASIVTAPATSSTTPEDHGRQKRGLLDHDDRWSHLGSLWAHRAAVAQRRLAPPSSVPQAALDVGNIAVLQDAGDLVTRANPMDLGDVGLRLTPNPSGGYDASRIAYGFRERLGTRVTLGDDDSRDAALPFTFSYFGTTYDRVFINSDGNLTFREGDSASTERSVSRLLTGPPRIAPFFADLDPSIGGSVVSYGDAGVFTATWCSVREFGGPAAATAQVNLLPDGAIEIQVSQRTTIRSAIVGVSPGGTTDFTPVDLSANGPAAGGAGAIGEQFTTTSSLDVVAASRKFFLTHPDQYDNLILFTDTPLVSDAFAYEVSVANDIEGINLPVFNDSSEYGTRGQLQSICNMDALAKYPDNPFEKFLGENSTVSVLGQEVGHRWLAFLTFRDSRLTQPSMALLGRDRAHWSFFFDSDASVLEGNDIIEVGGGTFRTDAAVERYSLLDQYAMGLVDQTQVPPFFYVENPTNVVPRRTAISNPEIGVTFSGTRRTVTIDDVIAAVGQRRPSSAESPRVYRQAFVYVVSSGNTADPAAIDKLDRIRVAWDQFFSAATDSRMRAETRLARAGS